MSNYIVSARKYRPQNFQEVIGQEHVGKTLSNALQSNQLAQAFLFCGPRGVGKTTCARILAKVLNCQDRPNPYTACLGSSENCQSCKEDNSFNIFELDAASNNSVEHIRNLIDQVRFRPQSGEYKIFIIDEVHMLSTAAFNAFLKTLEEPPSYAIFILATTEKHKILPTILSRCQIFNFKRISVPDIIINLKSIAVAEEIQVEEEGLQLIAQKADGALRDALSIFDKVVSSSEKQVTYKNVIEDLNVLDADYYFKITDACLREDASSVILTFNEILKNGFESEIFIQGLSNHFRNLRLASSAKTIGLLDASEKQLERYRNQAGLLNDAYIVNALNILNQADLTMPISNQKTLHVELALTKIMYQNAVMSFAGSSDPTKKKTSRLSRGNSAIESNNDSTPTSTADVQSSKEVTPSSTGNETSSDVSEQKDETEKVTVNPGVPKKSFLTPSFSANINDLISDIKSKEVVNVGVKVDFTVEEIRKTWDEFKDELDMSSLKTSMSYVDFEIDKDIIRVFVPNSISKEYIIQESSIMELIRKRFQKPSIALNLVVAPSRFPEFETLETKKVLNDNEKIALMAKSNPLLKVLFDKFALKVEK